MPPLFLQEPSHRSDRTPILARNNHDFQDASKEPKSGLKSSLSTPILKERTSSGFVTYPRAAKKKIKANKVTFSMISIQGNVADLKGENEPETAGKASAKKNGAQALVSSSQVAEMTTTHGGVLNAVNQGNKKPATTTKMTGKNHANVKNVTRSAQRVGL